MASVCVITAGHLSTCPRMLKAADALAGAGYRVRVVSTRHVGWATATDIEVRKSRSWEWDVVDYDRGSAPRNYLRSGVRHRAAQLVSKSLGPRRFPMKLAAQAYSRAHSELVRAALARPADFFYGGTTGALAATAMAARRARAPYAIDLEDFHSDEQDAIDGPVLARDLAEIIESEVLFGASFLTTSSEAIASAYADKYGVRPIVIHNTFPLPEVKPDLAPSEGDGLRLYWFSQTIGPRRGLEDAAQAMGLAAISGELHLRGRPAPGYLESLESLAARVAPALKLVHHFPTSPDSMLESCRGYDVGLALEQGVSFNNRIALSNKAFTYMLGGLAVVFTDTPAQRALALDVGEGALLYQPGDVESLAAGLKRWARDKRLLAKARAVAWEAARRRWHWQHPEERGALLEAFLTVLK